jgi:hypothetical protein
MRMYAEEWVTLISLLRPDLADAQVRVVSHTVFGMINSLPTLNSGLDVETITATVRPMALNAMLVAEEPAREGPAPAT